MNPRTARWFQDYADAHRHPMNRLTHKIAIPAIVFHIVAMLAWIDLGVDLGPARLTAGLVAWVLTGAFWVAHLPLTGALLMLLTLPMALWGGQVDRALVIGLAAVGWLVQLAGHAVWEKNRPAFLDNLLQALVGPLFFLAVLLGQYRPRYDDAARG
jgi:uncharacterized membrane protein YGL010W